MSLQNFLILIILPFAKTIWPPSYKINLTHEEIFELSEIISSDDMDDIFETENEMIKEHDLKKFNLNKDIGKYLQLHKLSVRRNQEESDNDKTYNLKYQQKLKEVPYEEEAQPWEGGIVDKNGDLKSDSKIIFNLKPHEKRESKSHKSQIQLRKVNSATTTTTNNISTTDNDTDKDYDYKFFKAAYEYSIRKTNKMLNYTESKDEETVKEAVKVIVKAGKTGNCTAADRRGIGITAVKCIWRDITSKELSNTERKAVFRRIITIILIWVFVYLLVAIPCWCQRGWCCCCFQCQFCKPLERINGAKKYLLDNPLGVYHTPDYERVSYTPTNYEKYAQKKLEKALMKL